MKPIFVTLIFVASVFVTGCSVSESEKQEAKKQYHAYILPVGAVVLCSDGGKWHIFRLGDKLYLFNRGVSGAHASWSGICEYSGPVPPKGWTFEEQN